MSAVLLYFRGGSSVGGVSLQPFLLMTHTGTDRLWNIESYLIINHATFLLSTKTGLDRVANIENTLTVAPFSGTTFYPYPKAGVDRLWAIEEYLLSASGSSG